MKAFRLMLSSSSRFTIEYKKWLLLARDTEQMWRRNSVSCKNNVAISVLVWNRALIQPRFTYICYHRNGLTYIPFVDPQPATVNLLPVINPLLSPAMGKQIGLMYFEYVIFVSRRSRAISWCLSRDLSLYSGWTMIFSTPTSTTGSAHFRIWPVGVLDGIQSSSVSILYSPRRMLFLWFEKKETINIVLNWRCAASQLFIDQHVIHGRKWSLVNAFNWIWFNWLIHPFIIRSLQTTFTFIQISGQAMSSG